jgi:hypothetical protein
MAAMKLKVQLIIESDSGETEVMQEVAELERHSLRPENLGLMLSEAKELLHEVQKAMVTHQTTRYLTQQISWPGMRGKPLAQREASDRVADALRQVGARQLQLEISDSYNSRFLGML